LHSTYPLSLHDALPICLAAKSLERQQAFRPLAPLDPEDVDAARECRVPGRRPERSALSEVVEVAEQAAEQPGPPWLAPARHDALDRKSTRLNSSHSQIS